MYGKIFESIYDGSLACGDWKALITFQQLIILADQDGVVDMTDIAIHRRTTIPLEIIQKGIEELLKPDPHSRSKDEDGRRLVLLDSERDWGWVIVNYEHYRKLANAAERREQNRQAQQRSRAKRQHMSAPVSNGQQTSAQKSHIDVDVNIKNTTSKTASRFDEFWICYPKKSGKKKTLEIWKRRKLDSMADKLILDVKTRIISDRKWIDGFIPNPTTYLNGDRWEDEMESGTIKAAPKDDYSHYRKLGNELGIHPDSMEPDKEYIQRVKDAQC